MYCWNNAVAESFFHSLKTELIHHETFYTKAQANEKIFEYIEIFYNRQKYTHQITICHQMNMKKKCYVLNSPVKLEFLCPIFC